MLELFCGVFDKGGNQYDAAIVFVLTQIEMLIDGLPEFGVGRTEPLSPAARERIRDLVAVSRRCFSTSA